MARFDGVIDTFWHLAREVARATGRRRRPTATKAAAPAPAPGPTAAGGYPGDYEGMPTVTYDPHPGTLPDPGEIVWVWVPYEEDHSRGKDRPVLLVGRDGDLLLGLPLTSEDHDRDADQEAAEGRFWLDIGSGAWDSKGRPSEVRLNRVLRIDPAAVRKTSGKLPKATFDAVAEGMRQHLT